MRILAILAVIAVTAMAAAEPAKPDIDIPDPFGLGERLALIDYLREHDGVLTPAGATYDELVALYWQKHHPATTEDEAHDLAQSEDRKRRMRADLAEHYKQTLPDDATEDQLRAALEQARATTTKQAADAAIAASEKRDRPSTPEEAHAAANADQAELERYHDHLDSNVAELKRTLDSLSAQAKQRAAEFKASEATLNKLENEVHKQHGAYETAVLDYNDEVKHQGAASDATRRKVDRTKAAAATADTAYGAEEVRYLALQHDDEVAKRRESEVRTQIEGLLREQRTIEQQIQDAHRRALESAGSQAPASGVPALPPGGFEDRLKSAVVLIVVKNRGTGSGFFVNAKGYVVTNAHVVGDGTTPMVALWDAAVRHQSEPLTVVAVDAARDLALLRLTASGATAPAVLDLSDVYELSRPLLAVGFPLAAGLAETLGTAPTDIVVSRGSLNAVRRDTESGHPQWVQHDCRIASGSSGGPLIDLQTLNVIGVNTMVVEPGKSGAAGDSVNLAIPSNVVREVFSAYLEP